MTEIQTPTLSLAERAKQALAEETDYTNQAIRETEQKMAEKARAHFRKVLGEEPEIIHPGGYIEHQGLKFFFQYSYDEGGFVLHLVQTCPQCGMEMLSYCFSCLSRLGELLENFESHHTCPTAEPEPETRITPAEVLYDVLRDIVRDVVTEMNGG